MDKVYIENDDIYTFEYTPNRPTFEVSFIGFNYSVYKAMLEAGVNEPYAYACSARDVVFTRPMSLFSEYSSCSDHYELIEKLVKDRSGFAVKQFLYGWYEGGLIMAAPDIPENTDWKWRIPTGSEADSEVIWDRLPDDVPFE